jgi:CheY-like chemotaxis protein
VIGNLDILRERRKADTDVQELAGDALDAALRGADLTRRLLAFDAMPTGGKLIVATRNRHLDAAYAAQHPEVVAGDHAMIEVSDSGCGISPEMMPSIFEPFFTTKEQGKGTGLGLSMVYGFIKQSGGHINVYSEVGMGTTFRLYFRRSRNKTQPAFTEVVNEALNGRGETVLVVEDNLSLRHVAVRQLKELGYKVLEADDAQLALATLESAKVDVLFTDIVMPGGTGFELAEIAQERCPSLRVVFTSGFPDARIKGNGMRLATRLLNKPYRKQDLAKAVREALDNSPDTANILAAAGQEMNRAAGR